MEESFKTFKSIIDFMTSIGWDWKPLMVSVILLLVARIIFEPDVIDVNSQPDKRYRGLIKLAAFIMSCIGGVITQIVIDRPADSFARSLSIIIGISDAGISMIGYSLFDFLGVMGRIKDKFGWQPKGDK